jgi:hypothetical protein
MNRAAAQVPSLGGVVGGAKIAATKKAVGAVLNTDLPIKLDATNLYTTVENPPGGPFDPTLLNYTQATVGQPLAPGDYEVTILAFCTEYSIHRPGAGVAYSSSPWMLAKCRRRRVASRSLPRAYTRRAPRCTTDGTHAGHAWLHHKIVGRNLRDNNVM